LDGGNEAGAEFGVSFFDLECEGVVGGLPEDGGDDEASGDVAPNSDLGGEEGGADCPREIDEPIEEHQGGQD
jgi:hypothetical protein